jgi:hypothetical protein
VDEHHIDIHMAAPQARYQLRGLGAAQEVREEAESYRRESLAGVPER